MDKTFFKQMNPGAPDSGCVKISYKKGGKVSKKFPRVTSNYKCRLFRKTGHSTTMWTSGGQNCVKIGPHSC